PRPLDDLGAPGAEQGPSSRWRQRGMRRASAPNHHKLASEHERVHGSRKGDHAESQEKALMQRQPGANANSPQKDCNGESQQARQHGSEAANMSSNCRTMEEQPGKQKSP